MGLARYRRSVRASLASVGMAAATASALVMLQTSLVLAAEADAITVVPGSGAAITVGEGNLAERQLVGKFTDTGRPAAETCDTEGYVATINWGDGSSSEGTLACESNSEAASGVFDVYGSHTYADSGPYSISLSVVDNSEDGESSGAAVKTDTANVTDAGLEFLGNNSDGPFVAVEGKSIFVQAGFHDSNNAYPNKTAALDAGLSGTINWGDGTVQNVAVTAPPSNCEICAGDFIIQGSHVYDAPIPAGATLHITITAKDDGGATATDDSMTVDVSDGALTAGSNLSLGANATQAFNSVVGTFTDEAAAQAAAADFVAIINWGDNTSSTGTVTKTGTGAFGVSGTHAYATTGSKSISATVTDEEGSTVTLRATAVVAAAPVAPVTPVVLPATGQPQQPSLPLVPLGLVILGLASLVAGGRILAKMPR